MSELKEHQFCRYDEIVHEFSGDFPNDLRLYYLKSEADNVIAELKEKLKVQTSIAEEGWKEAGTYHTSYAEEVKELYDKNKEIAELKEERRWRKCSEELPSPKQRVLFLAKYKTDKVREWIGDFRHIDGMKLYFAVFYASAPGWGCEFLIDEVIGWMPLPKALEEAK